MTLEPGDVVLTGTPPGVGCFRKPPLWLKVRLPLYIAFGMIYKRKYNIIISYDMFSFTLALNLQKGDVVECEIDEIGKITNHIQ